MSRLSPLIRGLAAPSVDLANKESGRDNVEEVPGVTVTVSVRCWFDPVCFTTGCSTSLFDGPNRTRSSVGLGVDDRLRNLTVDTPAESCHEEVPGVAPSEHQNSHNE
jgi:hypothetical protein